MRGGKARRSGIVGFRNPRIVPENRSWRTTAFPELSLSLRFISREESFKVNSMSTDLSKNKARFGRGGRSPLVYAVAVAVIGLVSMLIVDHGPWNRPHVGAAEAHYASTSAAARAAGATVTPTLPKSGLEPEPPVPKPVQPANPATP